LVGDLDLVGAPQHCLDLRRADKVEVTDQANANALTGLVLGKGKVRALTHCAHPSFHRVVRPTILRLPAAVHGS